MRGTVINLHRLGAIVRLTDGSLAAVPGDELASHRAAYEASLARRTPLELALVRGSGRPIVTLADGGPLPTDADPAFEARLSAYLKATEEWAPPDRPPPAERHFIRKKRRAKIFEARPARP
ncbi:MAG: hypothetical protein ACREM2_00380 [Vulcanimicrobiaceae bacterium]